MKRLPATVRARILLRSLTIQGSWNYETLIGTGFAYTILPALRVIHGDGSPRLRAAVGRHIELFNSHPYTATVAIGAVTRLEADGVEPAVIQRFKSALRGSLGSIVDRLVWGTWRPLSMLLAIVLLLAGARWWIAITSFLFVYNLMHLTIRTLGLRLGSEAGLEVGRRLRNLPIQPFVERSSQIACALIGVAVVLAMAPVLQDPLPLALSVVAVITGFLLGIRTRRVMIALVAIVSAIALLMGMMGYGA